ncbi:hypothetical protein H7I40_13305 [Mycolicibacterium madagascariense]|nr:hypothetical protein [Mycolicibacterium madagascariense]
MGIGTAATASASSRPAPDTIAQLEAEGYHVQVNGPRASPLSYCSVTDVHGLRNSNVDDDGKIIDQNLHTTVYVDIACQNH